MAESVEPLESFRDCWSTFRRQALAMLAKPCSPEEAQELLKSRDALLLRLRRLRKSDEGSSMPKSIILTIEPLQSFASFDSLSDAKTAQLEDLVRDGEIRIQAWFAGIERKTVYQISVTEKENRDRVRRTAMAAAAFVALTALMSAATIQIYLNRSIR